MLKKRTVLGFLLAISAFLLSACASGSNAKNQDAALADSGTIEYVNQFEVSEVTAFTYVYEGQLLLFDLEDGKWQSMGDSTRTFDQKKVEEFLEEMSEMSASEVFENVEDLSVYGVDQPTQMFAVVFVDQSSLTYCFGKTEDGSVYLQVTNDADDTFNANVYRVDESYVTTQLNHPMEDFQ